MSTLATCRAIPKASYCRINAFTTAFQAYRATFTSSTDFFCRPTSAKIVLSWLAIERTITSQKAKSYRASAMVLRSLGEKASLTRPFFAGYGYGAFCSSMQ